MHHYQPLIIANTYLGVILQSNLKFDIYVQEIVTKANCTLGLIRRNVKTISMQSKEHAYKALVHPQLEYECMVWSPWQNYLINTIEKVQLHDACCICNNNTNVSALINELNWDSL